jgi:cytochrome c553
MQTIFPANEEKRMNDSGRGAPIGPILLLTACLVLSGCLGKKTLGNDASLQATLQVCSTCHGFQGRSSSPVFPVLAGQQHDYLVTQLQTFRNKSRADQNAHVYMWGVAANLDDATIESVASYFAQQTADPGQKQDAAEIAAGAAIYKTGVAAREVPPCGACHGDDAHGNGAVPRLAGQHRAYLASQLEAFKSNVRANDMMNPNAKNMTPQDIEAVSAYLASL